MRRRIQKAGEFIRTGLWRTTGAELPRSVFLLLRQLQTIILSLKKFSENRCQLRASMLTLYSLLSIVPVMAMAFGIAHALGMEAYLQQRVMEHFASHPEVVSKVFDFSHRMLKNTRGGLMATVGTMALFFTVVLVIAQAENALDETWEIRTKRGIGKKILKYLILTLICPLLIIASSSATFFFKSQLSYATEKIALLKTVSPLLFLGLKFLPILIIWIVFIAAYRFIPNSNVRLSSALFSGIVTGSIFQAAQSIFILFQVRLSQYNAIYGSFAVIPLLMLFIYLSWMIFLFGSELCYAFQNVGTYLFYQDAKNMSPFFKRCLTLFLLSRLAKDPSRHFCPDELASEHSLPLRLVNLLLFELKNSGLVISRIDEGCQREFYGIHPEKTGLSFFEANRIMDHTGSENLPVSEDPDFKRLYCLLKKKEDKTEKSMISLKEL